MTEKETLSEILISFLNDLQGGAYDDEIGTIASALDERREILKDDLRKRVKEIFGEDAEVSTGEMRKAAEKFLEAQPKEESKNLFVKKAQQVEPQQPPMPLDHLDSLEDQMATEDQGPMVGRGGAIIGGMRMSDMN